MLIRRAFPKYIGSDDIDIRAEISDRKLHGLYFNRGSSALKFLVQTLASLYEKNLVVAMQTFNCGTVLEAVLEAQCAKVVLFDVKKDDFSISIDDLKQHNGPLDILFLLHYQGIYNRQYQEIITYCKQKNILVIEDLAHLAECRQELMGEYGIYSYSFDKPFTVWSGGKIIASNKNTDAYQYILQKYEQLPYETRKQSKKDLRLLKFLLQYSQPECYRKSLNRVQCISGLLSFFSAKVVYKICANTICGIFMKVFERLLRVFGRFKPIKYPVNRLNDDKIKLVNMQKDNHEKGSNRYRRLQERICTDLKLLDIETAGSQFELNRINFCSNKPKHLAVIECGNYNWPQCLHHLFSDHPHVILKEQYAHADYLAKHVINFPCWSDEVCEILQEKNNE
jgi:hypothetical protein